MSSPSQPVNILSPKRQPKDELSSQPGSYASAGLPAGGERGGVGTPALLGSTPRAIKARYYYYGTPPPPNIPPRGTAAAALASSGANTPLGKYAGTSSPSLIHPSTSSPGDGIVKKPLVASPGQVVGGLSASRELPCESDIFAPISTPTPIPDLDDLHDDEKAKVLERHLVSKQSRANLGETPSRTGTPLPGLNEGVDKPKSTSGSIRSHPSEASDSKSRRSSQVPHPQRMQSEAFPIHFDAPGADVTHDIYKWHTDQRRQAGRVRSASFAGPSNVTEQNPAFEHIHEPGGFRRNYVKLRAEEQGSEEPQMLNNFIDFLFLFGHFAGEDLEEDEDEDKDQDLLREAGLEAGDIDALPTETTALLGSQTLGRARSRSRRRRGASVSGQGTATVTQAVLMLLKSFIGTGVLFLGKAFFNGGLLFSAVTFTFIAAISLYSFLLLVKTKFVVSGSFGDIGGTLYGPWMRYLILGSIVFSQLGFVAAYTIFVAQSLQAFVLGVTNCATNLPIQYFIVMELVVFLPLALVRDLAKLSSTALIADGFILLGLLYIFGSEFSLLATRGVADIKLFNPRDFPLFVGTAVFSFEGIGLVIPITDAMKEPHKFPKALTGVMIFLTVLFGGAGALAYVTFGSSIQTVVLVNLDVHSKMVQSVQFLYAMAILLSVPLQLFPAIRILENGLFTRSGKGDVRVKWTKNLFRWVMVLFTTVLSTWGAGDLDKFVALIGCFACVPLCYVYPAMLHYRACSRTKKDKAKDIALIIFGLLAAGYTTVQTMKLMIEPSHPAESPMAHCKSGAN
ncbi:transmembrane amino acid transporter protein-domain-containing protein [Crepidotus variabilis]|uniref:Transmembrane amino acid transporter protein-domain-containing protein n=1 Tax=Crepidotus variabilis TaxID=179855 RepID=A0A9P6JMP9_9AGAR|nr:transmembrane amino acid transporter protein-domain-containing protein [Crepidotus variabilis]